MSKGAALTTMGGADNGRWTCITRDRLANTILLALVSAAAGLLSAGLAAASGGSASVWIADAIAAVWILRSPRSHLPALTLAGLAGGLTVHFFGDGTTGLPGLAAVLLGHAGAILAATATLRRLLTVRDRNQPEISGLLSIALATAAAGPFVGAALAALALGIVEGGDVLRPAAAWCNEAAAGAIIATPLLALWTAPAHFKDRDSTSAMSSALILAAVLACAMGAIIRFEFPFILITLPMMIAAVRLPPRWMCLLSSILAAILIIGAGFGFVPKLSDHPAEIHVATAITVFLPLCGCVLVWRMRQDRRALLLSNDQVRRTFDESAVAAAIATPDGRIIKANQAFCALFGRSVDEILNTDYHDITHPDDRALDDAIVGEVIETGGSGFEFEKRYLRKDGTAFWTRLHGTILRDETTGEPAYFVTQVFDIDQRKRAEDELALIRNRWTFALESAGQGVWDYDVVSGRTYHSPIWSQMLGLPPEAAPSENADWRKLVHPDDIASLDAVEAEHVEGRSDMIESTVRMRHADGHWVWILNRGRVIERDGEGRPLRIIGTHTDITRQKESEEKLATLNERIRLAAQAGGVGMWSWNDTRRELIWDERMFALYGLDPATAKATYRDWIDRVHPDDRATAEEVFLRALVNRCGYNTVFRVVLPSGEVRHIRALAHRRVDADGSIVMLGTNWDVTEQHLVAEALAAEKERLRVTLHSIGDAVICTDTQGRITFMNLAAETLTGSIEPLARGEALETIYRPVHEDNGEVLPSSVAEALRAGIAVEQQHPGKLVRKDGSARSIRDTAAPVRAASGEMIGAVLVFQDVTTARALQRDLAYAASHDALTGLKNRGAFEGALQAAHAEARSTGDAHAVLFVDLDRFKVLNDTAGHAAGDALLREVAAVIRNAVRANDVVARLGGDEFAILLRRCAIDDAERVGNAIIDCVKGIRFAWNGKMYTVGASVGITALTAQSIAVADVVAQADVACYAAKAGGRDRVSVYRPDSSEAHRALSDLHIAASIRESIEAGRFRLYAQEIRDLEAPLARGTKLEVLTRMVASDGSMISPGVFIPAAERFDLMGALDQWVLRTTLRTFGERIQAVPDLTVAVNLSANSLNDPGLWDFVSAELAATGFDPSRLVLEITETAVINNFGAAERFVETARRAGCRVSLDDFGSGVSSFSYLKRFAVDTIKIDGTFVRNMKSNHYDRTIVRLIHEIGAELGVDTVAEYVEDVETVDLLRSMGVRYGQGFLFHRPRPLGEVLDERAGAEPLADRAPRRASA